jgi:hypothetical protein
VTRNGDDVTATVGIESPVDPGEYVIVATAPGHVSFEAKVSATGEGMTVTVAVPSLEKAPEEALPDDAPPRGPAEHGNALLPEEPGPPPPRRGSGRKTLGLIVGGAGLAVAAGGLGVGVLARGKWDDAKAICGDDLGCDSPDDLERGNALVSDARTFGNVSTVLVGVGAAALVTGIILYVTAPDDAAPDEHAWRVAPAVDADGVYVTIGGAL